MECLRVFTPVTASSSPAAVVDRVGALDLERDGLPRQGLDEDLHPAAQAEHQVERRLLLDVVVQLVPPVVPPTIEMKSVVVLLVAKFKLPDDLVGNLAAAPVLGVGAIVIEDSVLEEVAELVSIH